jgi:hypothetical protein
MKNLLVALLLSLPAAPAAAGGSAGAEPFNFLFIDANARPAGMGGAYSALATDVNALRYNPAGLARRSSFEATFMHNQYLAGITQEYLAAVSPYGFGGDINYLNSGAVARTTISNPDGAGLDAAELKSAAVGLGYGRAFGDELSAGVALRMIHEKIAGISAQGYAADLGALYRVPWIRGLSAALVFQNLTAGPTVKFQGSQEELPINARMGLAYSFEAFGNKNALAMDVTKERNESALVYFGAETVIADALALRLGFNNRNTAGTGLTAGVGWVKERYSVDFAVASFGRLGFAHRVSATVRWGGEDAAPAPRKPAVSAAAARAASVDAETAFSQAEDAILRRDFERARESLRAAARGLPEQDARRARYFERMGYVSWLENDTARAKGFFIQSLGESRRMNLTGDSVAQVHAKLGLCWASEQNTTEAVKAFNAGLEAGPTPATRQFIEAQLAKLR